MFKFTILVDGVGIKFSYFNQLVDFEGRAHTETAEIIQAGWGACCRTNVRNGISPGRVRSVSEAM